MIFVDSYFFQFISSFKIDFRQRYMLIWFVAPHTLHKMAFHVNKNETHSVRFSFCIWPFLSFGLFAISVHRHRCVHISFPFSLCVCVCALVFIFLTNMHSTFKCALNLFFFATISICICSSFALKLAFYATDTFAFLKKEKNEFAISFLSCRNEVCRNGAEWETLSICLWCIYINILFLCIIIHFQMRLCAARSYAHAIQSVFFTLIWSVSVCLSICICSIASFAIVFIRFLWSFEIYLMPFSPVNKECIQIATVNNNRCPFSHTHTRHRTPSPWWRITNRTWKLQTRTHTCIQSWRWWQWKRRSKTKNQSNSHWVNEQEKERKKIKMVEN